MPSFDFFKNGEKGGLFASLLLLCWRWGKYRTGLVCRSQLRKSFPLSVRAVIDDLDFLESTMRELARDRFTYNQLTYLLSLSVLIGEEFEKLMKTVCSQRCDSTWSDAQQHFLNNIA